MTNNTDNKRDETQDLKPVVSLDTRMESIYLESRKSGFVKSSFISKKGNNLKNFFYNAHVKKALVAALLATAILNINVLAVWVAHLCLLISRFGGSKIGAFVSSYFARTRVEAAFNLIASYIPRGVALFMGLFIGAEVAGKVAVGVKEAAHGSYNGAVKFGACIKGIFTNPLSENIRPESVEQPRLSKKKSVKLLNALNRI